MPIKPYLSGRTFASETIAVMGTAFEDACKTLKLGADNPARAMLARIIILLVEEGATDADRLAVAAIREMRGTRNAAV
jgi:hypothetical protein